MRKIGIIGLGDIAQKAYLPVISKKNLEIHLCTRNEYTLRKVSEQYRINHLHQNLDSLINSGITGAFVHTATASHYDIVEQLLNNNIHVYIDKPVTYDFASTEKLIELSTGKNLILTVGFNRRFAPAYQFTKELINPNMIMMQKNRKSLPGDVRTFIFDDFIHVIDTLLYLFPYPIQKMLVNGMKRGERLYHVVVQLIASDGATAIGIMNRDSGTTEEKLEVFGPMGKQVVYNVSEVVLHEDKHEKKLGINDWAPTLFKRGFEQIVDDFLLALTSGKEPEIKKQDILHTHKICEEVVLELNKL
jgi:virulence factor